MMTHKEMTAHIRGRIKQAGIKARVRLYTACGYMWIQVFPTTFGARFTDDEQREIAIIAQVNKLRFAQGMAIDENQGTYGPGFTFLYHEQFQN